MNSGKIFAGRVDGTGGEIKGSTRGPRGPKKQALLNLWLNKWADLRDHIKYKNDQPVYVEQGRERIPFNRNPLKIVSQNRWQIIHSIIMIALLFRSENGEIYLHREDDNPVWLMAEYACAAAVRPIHMQDYHEERSPACNSAINNQCTISLFSIINAPSFFFQ